jgi:hypothetical protein
VAACIFPVDLDTLVILYVQKAINVRGQRIQFDNTERNTEQENCILDKSQKQQKSTVEVCSRPFRKRRKTFFFSPSIRSIATVCQLADSKKRGEDQ